MTTICWDVRNLINKKEEKRNIFWIFSSRPFVPLIFSVGSPLEVLAIFRIYNINNSKLEHIIKITEVWDLQNKISAPPSIWEWLPPPTYSPNTIVVVEKGCPLVAIGGSCCSSSFRPVAPSTPPCPWRTPPQGSLP